LPNVDIDVVMMDNDFSDPDLDRFLEEFEEKDPSVAVLGDAYTEEEARELNRAGCEVLEEHPYKEAVVVPKCREAFDVLDEDLTLGYPNGYSELKPEDYSSISDWRGRKVHVLGGSPELQWEEIQKLTQPNLAGDPPADIRGTDWNGFQKIAYLGEYWSREGWQSADHLSIRETVRKSLEEIKAFWEQKGVWPETEPRELHGPAVLEPEFEIFIDKGGDPIPSREDLEKAYVEEYEEKGSRLTETRTRTTLSGK
jgi:hypothetical protein